MSKRFDMDAAVNNFMATARAGWHWKRIDALIGGKTKRQTVIKEAVKRHLIKVHQIPGGPDEIEIIQ